jgi:hypothetical protein
LFLFKHPPIKVDAIIVYYGFKPIAIQETLSVAVSQLSIYSFLSAAEAPVSVTSLN